MGTSSDYIDAVIKLFNCLDSGRIKRSKGRDNDIRRKRLFQKAIMKQLTLITIHLVLTILQYKAEALRTLYS